MYSFWQYEKLFQWTFNKNFHVQKEILEPTHAFFQIYFFFSSPCQVLLFTTGKVKMKINVLWIRKWQTD